MCASPDNPCARINPPARPSVPPPMRVLFVDDEELVRRAFRRSMRRHGIEVVESSSGEDALVRHAQDPSGFDVVITDLHMGGISGLELIERLAARGAHRFVVMSGVGIIESSSPVPGVVYVEKPWEPSRVVEVLRGLTGEPAEVHAA